ncbi:MAG: biopolymer transporter ExbD [Acidobacteriota bacterium]
MALKPQSLSPSGKKQIGTSLSEINVTPFIDVMLVLLVIFMVTAPLMQSGIGVNLPKAETESAPAEEGLTITITKDRFIHVGGAVVNINLLERKLQEYFAGKPKKLVFIAADEGISYGFFIDTLDVIRKAGIIDIGLVTDPKELRSIPKKK